MGTVGEEKAGLCRWVGPNQAWVILRPGCRFDQSLDGATVEDEDEDEDEVEVEVEVGRGGRRGTRLVVASTAVTG